jgi:hypothetical protein
MVLCCIYFGNPAVLFDHPNPPIALNYFPTDWGGEALRVMMRDVNGYPSREGGFCLPRVENNSWTRDTASMTMRDVLHKAG